MTDVETPDGPDQEQAPLTDDDAGGVERGLGSWEGIDRLLAIAVGIAGLITIFVAIFQQTTEPSARLLWIAASIGTVGALAIYVRVAYRMNRVRARQRTYRFETQPFSFSEVQTTEAEAATGVPAGASEAASKLITELRADLASLRLSIREKAAADLSVAATAAADEAIDRARVWARGLAASVVALIGAVVWIVARDSPHDSVGATTSSVLASLVVLGVPLYLVRLCATQFRLNQHIRLVMESRRSIIQTFSLFLAAEPNEEARAKLLEAVAGEVFTNPATGLYKGQTEAVAPLEVLVTGLADRVSRSS